MPQNCNIAVARCQKGDSHHPSDTVRNGVIYAGLTGCRNDGPAKPGCHAIYFISTIFFAPVTLSDRSVQM